MLDNLDEVAVLMRERGPGRWELDLDGESLEMTLETVEITDRGFHAEGRNERRGELYELTTGIQPGGEVQLRRRALDADEWESAGHVEDARQIG